MTIAPDLARAVAALARASSFAAAAPLSGSIAVPRVARAVLAIVLAPAISAHVAAVGGDGPALLAAVLRNALIGAAIGMSAAAVASAATGAGGAIDAAIASQAVGRESVFGSGAGPVGRLFSLGFAVAMFSTGSFATLCGRVVVAQDAWLRTFALAGCVAVVRDAFEGALAIAVPALAAQLLAITVAAFVSRAAPRINGLMLASPATAALVLITLAAGVAGVVMRFDGLARFAASMHAP
jgi:flagellar biosynthesis protein FliR